MGITVLSLFNGMSNGMIAAENAKLDIDNYFSSEIDKYAMKVTKENYPNIKEIGDICKIKFENGKLYNENSNIVYEGKIDLVLAGSPCQGFSLAGKQGGTNARYNGEITIVSSLEQYKELKELGAEFLSQSYLFWEFVDIMNSVKEHNPNVKFMLENTKMSKNNLEMISNTLGVESILINSALLSAQNRERHYWFNFEIDKPEDLGILISDIIDTDDYMIGNIMYGSYTMNEKGKQFIKLRKDNKSNVLTTGIKNSLCIEIGHTNEIRGYDSIKRVYSTEGKCPTLTTMTGGHREPKIAVDDVVWRKLTPLECERLQTVPDNYTDCVSNSQRYKMLGNGWTVDVVAHIFKGLPDSYKINS